MTPVSVREIKGRLENYLVQCYGTDPDATEIMAMQAFLLAELVESLKDVAESNQVLANEVGMIEGRYSPGRS